MDILKFKPLYNFSINPTKANLAFFHDFLAQYPSDLLKIHYPLFFNCILIEIRKVSSILESCLTELIHLLMSMNDIDNSRILLLVFEDISGLLQNLVIKKGKSEDDFNCLDVHFSQKVIKIFDIILMKCKGTKNDRVIYSPSGLLLLGYIVSFLLHFVECYKEREVQIDALTVLNHITDNISPCLVNKANVVVNLAPGIFKSLILIIQSDRKVGCNVKSKALRCFGSLVALIYGDKSFSEGNNRLVVDGHCDLSETVVERSEIWRKETWEKVHAMIKVAKYSILGRSEEEHWKVRLELARMSMLILEDCDCIGPAAVDLVDCLIVISADTEATVCDVARKAINKVAKITFTLPVYWNDDNVSRVAQTGVLLLSSVVRDNIGCVIDSMKGISTILTDDGKCKTLQMLDGYLKIYDAHHLSSPSLAHLQQILSHLVTLCALDHRTIDLLEAVQATELQSHMNPFPRCDWVNKSFLHFYSERVYVLIVSVIASLVRIVNPNRLLSTLHSLSPESPDISAPVVLISRLIIANLCKSDAISDTDKITACRTILTTYFDPNVVNLVTRDDSVPETLSFFWNRPVAAIKDKSSTINIVKSSERFTPTNLKQNALVLALVMELCAECALCIRDCGAPEDTESWLMRTCLFEVMSKAQQSPAILSNSASNALNALSFVDSKYHRSISEVVRINGDYIMEAVARRLRAGAVSLRRSSNDRKVLLKLSGTCRCLMTLCQHADIGVLPFLSVVLDQLLLVLDSTHGAEQATVTPVLREVLRAVVRWTGLSLSPIMAISASTAVHRDLTSNVDIVRAFLVERNEILISSGLRKEADLVEENSVENEIQGADEPSQTTVIIRKIIDRCVHLSSSSSAQVRLSCLQIINDAVCALQTDKDVLNQVVHQLWSPLEHRLWDKEFPVILRAFDLLNCISQLSGGFLLVKIRTNLVSKLCAVLDNCSKISVCPTTSIKYTGLYKLQSSLLHFLSRLCVRTGLRGAVLEEVVDTLLLYLDNRHPADLTQACHESLLQLARYNPGIVWFKVAQVLPDHDARQVYGHLSRYYDTNYFSNAQRVLLYFNDS